MNTKINSCLVSLLVLGGSLIATHAQISIPDPGLNAAVRETLGKPAGLFTQSDMLSLTNLEAPNRNVSSIAGLEAARNLVRLNLSGNQLTNLTLPAEMTKLTTLILDGNPLTTFVLSELMATNLAPVVAALENQGVPVFIYPLTAQLVKPLRSVGAFKFGIIGPPGAYTVLVSSNLMSWGVLGFTSNRFGGVNFVEVNSNTVPRRFYRVLLQGAPPNMVFIPSNTFTMGTPASEVNRQPDEGPQTTVTITREFWIGKYEVTQREYLRVTGSNPSQSTGDLDRPVETVSYPDATNYCALLTQQELAAGSIAPGSFYRLPTEAEWECAARAGTSTRFSYGDDPNFSDLTNHAWYFFNSGIQPHPVGQKAPNPWGLYDMEGNVLEWTQDWYGPYPGGVVTDPQGPPSNLQGVKVIRGGAWDSSEPDCRSGRRLTKGVHPLITDSILGFRVVLVTESQ
jgi:formylglycine-generating enzyme required for sulfatase activity